MCWSFSVGGVALCLRQNEPLVIGGDGHPRSGQVSASDHHGAHLEIEALRRWCAYRLFRATTSA